MSPVSGDGTYTPLVVSGSSFFVLCCSGLEFQGADIYATVFKGYRQSQVNEVMPVRQHRWIIVRKFIA